MTGTRVTSSFGATSTAAQVLDGIDLTGRRAVVTGGASGIGVETVRALAAAGAEVTVAARDVAAGEKVATDLGLNVRVAPLDLADTGSVSAFVAAWDGPLHLLINNAGVMATDEVRTPAGWELQFATNHLGHVALTTGLFGSLRAEGARVVNLSSRGHFFADVDFDDLFFERRPYDRWLAYGQSKTANILFALAISRRWANEGITAYSVHPGRITSTNLVRYLDPEVLQAARSGSFGGDAIKSPEQGAATSVYVATAEGITSGRYYEDCAEAAANVPGERTGFYPYALDPDHAERLWDVSVRLLKETA